jgi:lipopolysaccharide transport system ATP-binding protein
MSSEIAIDIESVSKCYQVYQSPGDRLKQFLLPPLRQAIGAAPKNYHQDFWALKDISFQVKKGETVGIIGRNGSGKSTLLQIVCGTLSPSKGRVIVNGRIAALLELGSGFNPDFTGRENVFLNAAVLGLSHAEIKARFDDIVAFADIGGFVEQPIKTYSSGMLVRLAFAVAINVAPDVLIIDEALAVGDAGFQRKCMRKLTELTEAGTTLLFVSHDVESVKTLCSAALYLRKGRAVDFGVAKDVCRLYERDLFGNPESCQSEPPSKSVISDKKSTAIIDADLLQTHEKSYGDGRARIIDVAVTTEDGLSTNVLESGGSYLVSYRVVFMATVFRPIFGVMITNREGVCIFGTNTQNLPKSQREFDVGEELRIEFRLDNHLAPGIYFLTCGVHATDVDGNVTYLQRRMDVLILKSLQNERMSLGGFVNLYPTIKFVEEN